MRVAFYTLGCKVNQYETGKLMEDFIEKGWSVVSDKDIADLYVINTCTVTHLADRKSRQKIRKMKKLNQDSTIAVIGCYVEVNKEEVEAIEGVDIILGNKEKHKLPEIVTKKYNSQKQLKADEDLFFINNRTRAHIKIQEGCDRYCSYCIIPYARGPLTSRAIDDVVREANDLLDQDYKELVLTGINTALYGKISGSKENSDANIEILVKELNGLKGDFRIRLGSLEPNVIDYKLAGDLLKYEKLCHHMHLSLQSGSDRILKAMNRRYKMEDFDKIVEILRDGDPDYGISTDIIVGFPGESDEDFKASLKAIRDNKFVKTHAFPYSKRQGTPAAKMDDQISNIIKKERNALMIKAGEESAGEFLKGLIGKENRLLIEEYDYEKELLLGHSDNYVKAYVHKNKDEAEKYLNTFVDIKVKKAYDDGVLASILES